MKTYTYQMKTGIVRTKEFERKCLATHGVNVGLKCGHDCTYCSTPTMIRAHKAFKQLNISAFDNGYALVAPDTPQRVAHDSKHIKNRGMIQLCTISDAWSPEAQKYDLGRKCLEAVLSKPGWTVRILTKNAAVENDFDIISKYRDRVLLGLSITATPDKTNIISITEPNASPIPERLQVMQKAKTSGFRTYAMLCPLLPGIADSPDQIDELVKKAADFGAEEIFAEAVNPRGRGLILTQQALENAGFHNEAKTVETIRSQVNWSSYVAKLIRNLQQSVRKYSDINKLRFLLYPKGLTTNDLTEIKNDDAGVIWL
ncbi:MAG TPA: DNA photolyase [Phycisphaerales bacterium]|nr:DNA photolyase [Phycisphaerales bacterium]